MRLFLDTSALVKLYVSERGAMQVKARCAEAEEIIACVLVLPETLATLSRLRRAGKLRRGYRDSPALAQMKFETNRWYAVRVRVAGGRVEVWADGSRLIDLPVEGHTFAVEDQRAALKPLGLSAYQGTTGVRNVRVRRVDGGE